MTLAAGRDFLQVGAVAPDLPYASIADDDFFLTTKSELADKFHYEKTNEIPSRAFKKIKLLRNQLSSKELRAHFSFFIGYLSHVIADGVIHPFIRDKVGDYINNQTAHRVLEMQLDVLFCNYLTSKSGLPLELNNANIHDELKNLISYPESVKVCEFFKILINEVYSYSVESNEILGWVNGLHRMFGAAEGIPKIYRNLPFIGDFTFSDFDELKTRYNEILTLTSKKEGGVNFVKEPQVHFFENVIPRFYQIFLPVAQKAYEYVYEDGVELTENEISGIDLDTGRILAQNSNLDLVPFYWS
jgi:hypothetical protein